MSLCLFVCPHPYFIGHRSPPAGSTCDSGTFALSSSSTEAYSVKVNCTYSGAAAARAAPWLSLAGGVVALWLAAAALAGVDTDPIYHRHHFFPLRKNQLEQPKTPIHWFMINR